jgi:hypothetical protein
LNFLNTCLEGLCAGIIPTKKRRSQRLTCDIPNAKEYFVCLRSLYQSLPYMEQRGVTTKTCADIANLGLDSADVADFSNHNPWGRLEVARVVAHVSRPIGSNQAKFWPLYLFHKPGQ